MNSKTLFFSSLKKCDYCEYLFRYLTYAAAPVLTRAKPAELVSLKRSDFCSPKVWEIHKEDILDTLGLNLVELFSDDNSVNMLLYDEALIKEALADENAKKVLKSYDYSTDNIALSTLFTRLKRRFEALKFPHEIGIFLGYPPCDVESFIENEGKNCLFYKYWKVYHEPQKCQKAFERIDESKELALELLLNPIIPIEQTVTLLKAI